MGPRAARTTHLGLTLIGAVLYFLFVIPRWWVLTGDIPATLGTVGRIAAGVPIAAAAVPVMLTLQRSLKSQPAAPELALRFRAWSAVLHVVSGILIIATAVAEIWLGLDAAGPWLFAVYGAAGAIAVLAVLAFVLSFVAEKPPAPAKAAKIKAPKPRKPEKAAKPEKPGARPARIKSRRGRKKDTGVVAEQVEAESPVDTGADAVTDSEAPEVSITHPVTEETDDGETTVTQDAATEDTTDAPRPAGEPQSAPLDQRPTGKSRHRLRR